MLPLPSKAALNIFLLSLLSQQHDAYNTINTRRSFLDRCTSCCASLLINTLHPTAANADDGLNDVPSSMALSNNDPLYLARPIGVSSSNDGKDDSSTKSRPSAPIEFLLPATRVGLYIYQLLSIAEALDQRKKEGSTQSASSDKSLLIEQLDNLLLSPPSFIQSTDPTVTRGDPYNNMPPIIGELAVQQQKQKERKEQQLSIGMAPQLFEVGELMGERRQWSRLVQAERKREEASEVRRALNIYTTNLNFNPNKYVYSGSKEEKKRLIREDRLPSAREVIRSDLDARDLYRNDVQTKLEDVRAEYLYQKGVGLEDLSELVGLLNEAKVALDSWFGFIPDEDIKLALEAVKREQEQNS